MKRQLSVMMLGLRGLPNVQGGVETHVQNLGTELLALGCQVDVIVRSQYQPAEYRQQWQGMGIHPLWSPSSKSLEAIVHTFLGVLYAAIKRPDILHIHAIGPSLLVPLARLLGLTVIVTHHGQDYERQKWGGFAKKILKLGERFGMVVANGRIVISRVIETLVQNQYHRESVVIPNGVLLPERLETQNTIEKFGLVSGKYVLIVSRLVPEKRHLDLIRAFTLAKLDDWKLVIVGGSDHPDEYTESVSSAIHAYKNVVSTGFQGGMALKELYSNAGIFVLPSSHEGLPIALLEALSYGLLAIASDIPANLEVCLPEDQYFKLGDVEMLSEKLKKFALSTRDENSGDQLREWVSSKYNWKDIAEKTLKTYMDVYRTYSSHDLSDFEFNIPGHLLN